MSIKYCIWDVGQVIYPFSLDYLEEWVYSKTTNKNTVTKKGGVKSFNYKPYMLGTIDDKIFCRNICDEYEIPFEQKYLIEIKEALHNGVGKFFTETLKTMEYLSEQGIKNCILSNALPMLADTASELVKTEYSFCSFNLKLLKPTPEIYEKVRQNLNCYFEEMIFIDDKEQNVQSAQKLGIRGLVFNKKTVLEDCKKIIQENLGK